MTYLPSSAANEFTAGMVDESIFNRMFDPHLILDDQFRVRFANTAWRVMFGEIEETSAIQISDRSPPLSRCDHLIRALVTNLRPGQRRFSPAFCLGTAENAQGEADVPLQYWQIHASFLPARHEAAPVIVLRFDDVTMRTLANQTERKEKAKLRSRARLRQILAKEAEQRPNGHRARFERALALAGVGAWEVDTETGVAHCSERCLNHLGLAQVDALDRTELFIEQPDPIAEHWDLLQNGQGFECERCVHTALGRRWVLVRGTGQFASDGTMQHVLGLTLDITSRKEHELELSATAGAERSERERSEALATTMDHFIAAVSHELRSPLNAIVSWAELLQLVADPAHIARAGEAIRRNGRHLSLMVDDLLDSGAVMTGKLSVHLQPVDLGALTLSVVEDIRKAAEHKGLQLQTPHIEPCTVPGDESRLKQVVWNLLTNAIKFTEAGHIAVSVVNIDANAVLTVQDTGRGLDSDALPNIFDRFQQISPRSSGRVGGLGLGLWLIKTIVDLHGGTMAVASAGLGKGASFTVRLPLGSCLGSSGLCRPT